MNTLITCSLYIRLSSTSLYIQEASSASKAVYFGLFCISKAKQRHVLLRESGGGGGVKVIARASKRVNIMGEKKNKIWRVFDQHRFMNEVSHTMKRHRKTEG